MTVITASSISNLSTITGVAQDPNSDLLYIASSSGYIFTWNEATASFVSTIHVGPSLSSISVSPDGKTLAVGEYGGNPAVTAVGLVTLSSQSIQTLTLQNPGYEKGGVNALAYDADGNLLVGTGGFNLLSHFIPAGSQEFGTATVPGSSPFYSESWIEASPDHRYVQLLDASLEGAPLQLYDSQAGKVVAQSASYGLGTFGYNRGTGDINGNAGLIADIVGNDVLILDFSLQHQGGPGTTDTIIGAHFNESGSTLYLWDATASAVLIYDTKSWTETGSIAISSTGNTPNVWPQNAFGQMSLSHDGRYLTLLNGSGFQTIDLTNTVPAPPPGGALGGSSQGVITGVAQDAKSDLLYVATSTGYILTWNETTARFTGSLYVGRPLSSIALSADGKTLAVGEFSGTLDRYGDSPTTAVGLVTLSDHTIQTLSLGQPIGSEGGVVSLAFDANENLLVSTDGQGAPYHFIPAGSQSFGAATVSGSHLPGATGWVEASSDHRYVLLLESEISGAPLELYDTQAGKIIAQSNNLGIYNLGGNTGPGDINGSVGLIADVVGGALVILNFSLQREFGPSTSGGIYGAHFNASGSTLYLWDANSNAVLLYDTQSWKEIGSIAIPETGSAPTGSPLNASGQMSLSADGRYLTLMSGNGFQTLDLSKATAEISDSAAHVQAGLDGLQKQVAAGSVTAISLTDSGAPPALSLSAAQLSADDPALKAITSGFTLSVEAPSGSATLAGLGDQGHGTVFVLPGSAAQYGVASDGSGGVILTRDGVTDHFTGVTELKFSDVTEIVARFPGFAPNVTSGNIAELYSAVFGRQPDVAGLSFYTAYLSAHPETGLTTFATYFLSSAEYTGNPLHAYAASSAGDGQFITDCYQNLLGRAPSASDLDFYQSYVIAPMLKGLTPGSSAYVSAEAAAHAITITYISASAEYLMKVEVTSVTPADAHHWLLLV